MEEVNGIIMNETILVTGAVGFIGYHLSDLLLKLGFNVVGLDIMNDYYDIKLKKSRLEKLMEFSNFEFIKTDLTDSESIISLYESHRIEYVVHLAAQAGVRYSIENPKAYVDSNLVGFMSILEACRKFPVKHLIYASSSSVYGGNVKVPFNTNHNVDHPVSLYAATKKCNELLAHSYSHLYNIPTTGLRFFTVYGPWGRPDMAYFSFTKDIIEGKPIKVFNHGEMERDFTYINDIVDAIVKLIDKAPIQNNEWNEVNGEISSSFAPYKIYNIGNKSPVTLMRFINAIETSLGLEAKKEFFDMQPGDVLKTYADVADLEADINFKPTTSIEDGIKHFINWYRDYYKV